MTTRAFWILFAVYLVVLGVSPGTLFLLTVGLAEFGGQRPRLAPSHGGSQP